MGAVVPEVTVTLDRPRRLREDFNALARWEQVTGLNSRRSDHMATMVANPPAPCPACASEEGAPRVEGAEGVDAYLWRCGSCGHAWARFEQRDNLNSAQWSAFVWALLLSDDPSLDDGADDGGEGLRRVREWLGAPQALAEVNAAITDLQLQQAALAAGLATNGSASEGDPPPGRPSGRSGGTT